MCLLRPIKSLVRGAGHWIQEAYCSVGQRVAERLERVSDTIAERRHRARHPEWTPRAPQPAPRAVVEIPVHPVLNGHKYLH